MDNLFSLFRFDLLFRILVILLPFTTVLSVFTSEKLGIPGFSLYKEVLLVLLGCLVVGLHIRHKLKFEWTGFDLLIALYIVYLVVVSVFTTGISGIIYGGRYDFEFLIAFLILLHGSRFLEKKPSYYIKLFLISGGVMLIISMIVRFILSEDILLYLGFSGNPSNWQFGSSVPIFHGVEGANVRRFQGILDGPNTMGAFLLMYLGMFLYYFRYQKDWYFVIGSISFIFVGLIILTYSRSALIGLIGSTVVLVTFSIPYLYKKYRAQMLVLFLVFLSIIGVFFVKYNTSSTAIINRSGSTLGHYERIMAGLERFQSAPFGQGLGSAGPGYRYVQKLENRTRAEIESLDRFYIPESWYVQQLIEGGVFGAGIFAFLFLFLMISLYRVHPLWFATFFSICIMNLALHTFESSTISLSLFLFLGLILGSHHYKDFLHPYGYRK